MRATEIIGTVTITDKPRTIGPVVAVVPGDEDCVHVHTLDLHIDCGRCGWHSRVVSLRGDAAAGYLIRHKRADARAVAEAHTCSMAEASKWHELSTTRYPADIAWTLRDDSAAIATLESHGVNVDFGRVAICMKDSRPFSLRDAAAILAHTETDSNVACSAKDAR